ncbi:sodium/glutamate symporter [Thauera sp. SDU_THAU2]|uniref:sodium/glutamate symporter n=1 Tax=Thauera sp. SDU_THAU2 TaxID=3136633 RepID=UPI003120097D
MESTFHGVIAFALMAIMLLLGSLLRARIAWLRNALIPASITGGMIGFALVSAGLLPGFTAADFTALTFHFFTLSFMSLCLTGNSGNQALAGGSIVRGGLWLTVIWVISLGLQGVLGYGVIVAYDEITGADVSAFLGALITHGFTQGPGQALTYGGLWEHEFGIANATQVGLIYASLGFLVAFAVGVPMARWVIRRGLNANKASGIDSDFLSGFYAPARQPEGGRMVSHPANLDSLAFHICLLGAAYVITHVWLLAVRDIAAGFTPWGLNLGVLFSHNMFFLHGLAVCVLMRWAIEKAGLAAYVNDDTMKRITGGSVDFMVVGTLMSIEFAVLGALLVPILLVSAVITAATLIGSLLMGRLSGRLGYERAVTMFGCCCGSTGSGLLLLRMVDADFSTSVAKELAFYNIAIVVATFHILFIFAPIAPSLSTGAYIAIFGGTALAALVAVPLLMWRQVPQAGRAADAVPELSK